MIGLDRVGAACAISRRRILMAMAVALVLIAVGGILLLTSKAEDAHPGTGHSALIALVPVYAALVPIYIAAWRRRRNKNDV